MEFSEKLYLQKERTYSSWIIGADIGGTNTNIGIFGILDDSFFLLQSIHYKSQEVKDFTILFDDVIASLKKQGILVEIICIAAAGVVSENRDYVKPTNLNITISIPELQAKLKNKHIYLANDFEVIGYGIPLVEKEMLVSVKSGTMFKNGNKGILGAGTGLGKCIMVHDDNKYVPLASEGGHADFAMQNKKDLEFADFIQKREKGKMPISWESVLSGNGIALMYQYFLLECQGYCDETGPRPDEIFSMRSSNQAASKTVEYYAELYARCARNFALDSLSLGGLYIAGGIAAKNVALFQTDWFLKTFTKNYKQRDLLEHMQIFVIADYNVSLYGAAYYAMKAAAFPSS